MAHCQLANFFGRKVCGLCSQGTDLIFTLKFELQFQFLLVIQFAVSSFVFIQVALIFFFFTINRSTSSSTRSAATRTSYTRSYDLYDAEMDSIREKRSQCYLGGMAATQVICICPLMILRSVFSRSLPPFLFY